MKMPLGHLGLWALVCLCAVTIIVQSQSLGAARAADAPAARTSLVVQSAPSIRDRSRLSDSIAAAAEYFAAHDPFRIGHAPSLVAYGSPTVVAAPPIQRPTLLLLGIVGSGNHWSAVVGGIPGRDGHLVLQAGDTAGGLRVKRINAGVAVIEGRDTTWTLRPGNPWP